MPIELTFPDARTVLVTIDNPAKRNALGLTEFETLASVWRQLSDMKRVRCVVLTGRGQAAFCAGAQLDVDFSTVAGLDDLIDRALLKTQIFPKPIVAAINGHCVAGGMELMLATDVRVVAESALLGLPEVRWGIFPSGGGAMKLIEQIGYARAMKILLTGELINATEAMECGLVNRVEPAGKVLEVALCIAKQISDNSPTAVQMTKQAALNGLAASWNARETKERVLANQMRESVDNKLGRQSFLKKEKPEYFDPD